MPPKIPSSLSFKHLSRSFMIPVYPFNRKCHAIIHDHMVNHYQNLLSIQHPQHFRDQLLQFHIMGMAEINKLCDCFLPNLPYHLVYLLVALSFHGTQIQRSAGCTTGGKANGTGQTSILDLMRWPLCTAAALSLSSIGETYRETTTTFNMAFEFSSHKDLTCQWQFVIRFAEDSDILFCELPEHQNLLHYPSLKPRVISHFPSSIPVLCHPSSLSENASNLFLNTPESYLLPLVWKP